MERLQFEVLKSPVTYSVTPKKTWNEAQLTPVLIFSFQLYFFVSQNYLWTVYL